MGVSILGYASSWYILKYKPIKRLPTSSGLNKRYKICEYLPIIIIISSCVYSLLTSRRFPAVAATSINGDFETERDASMVTSDADDSKLSALYSSTSSLSSSSPPTLPFVSDIIPHQVQVVSTSPMMGSTIHIVPQTRNSSSLPPNALQQQTLTFVHHKDALSKYRVYYNIILFLYIIPTLLDVIRRTVFCLVIK